MSTNQNLNKARNARRDEFYTQRSDIVREVEHYKDHFKDKVVYSNCDDPLKSSFVTFFIDRFHELGIKKFVVSYYENPKFWDYPEEDKYEPVTYLEYEGKDDHGDLMDAWHLLKGDGDFRSAECIELLKQSDIVCTNPPFSLFREYIAQLIKYDKKFLIIGPINGATYANVFPLIKEGKIWLGKGFKGGRAWFRTTENSKYDMKNRDPSTGLVKFGNMTWFTNLDHDNKPDELILTESYCADKFPKYDNYDAIEVGRVKKIPKDYDGVMGVPVSFLEKHNSDQFELLGVSEQCGKGLSYGLWDSDSGAPHPLIDGNRKYSRLFIQRKNTT